MLIPVQLYIFINHIGTVFRIWIWYPLPNRTVDFFLPVLTTSSIVIDSSWEWLHHRTLYDKLWRLVFSFYNLMFFRRNSQFFGQMISSPPPWKKNGPYAYASKPPGRQTGIGRVRKVCLSVRRRMLTQFHLSSICGRASVKWIECNATNISAYTDYIKGGGTYDKIIAKVNMVSKHL